MAQLWGKPDSHRPTILPASFILKYCKVYSLGYSSFKIQLVSIKRLTCRLEVSQSVCNWSRCSASWATRWVTPDSSTTWPLRSSSEVRLNTKYIHTNEYWNSANDLGFICLASVVTTTSNSLHYTKFTVSVTKVSNIMTQWPLILTALIIGERSSSGLNFPPNIGIAIAR